MAFNFTGISIPSPETYTLKSNTTKKLHVIVECGWPEEDYDGVLPELILEDALIEAKDGVRVYLDPEKFHENHKGIVPLSLQTDIQIPVATLQFTPEGNTIWVHTPDGATALCIQCSGKIKVDKCLNSPFSHCDIQVQGNIDFCVSGDAKNALKQELKKKC
ncbi:hypothetical protein [Chitinophaga japonensis]|uniref:Uncharacterized protein n=1 Tax=Chitinophaga japonensis TaxID=104662 RepID=A0A562T397_CHIJA|nr:hypothetical protein [Chitinophaga japonensis]TWI87798.1 hypothetical protein LX66_1869 [Chitinophaga japonensis]